MHRLVAAALWLAACGDDGSGGPLDAPNGVPEGDVTVTTAVRRGAFAPGTPLGGVMIDVRLPDGRPGGTAVTDPEGHTTLHQVPAGATVSAIYPAAQSVLPVTSFVGVQPGDHLTFGDGYFPSQPRLVANLEVHLDELPGGTGYTLATSCGQTQSQLFESVMSVSVSGCFAQTGSVVMFVNGPDGLLAGSRLVTQVPYSNGTLIGPAPWVTNDRDNFAVSVTGLDHQVALALDATAAYGDQLLLRQVPIQGLVTDGTTTTSQITMPVTAPRIVGHAQLAHAGSQGPDFAFAFTEVYRAIDGSATSIQLTAPTVPSVGGMVFDPELRQAAWLQSDGDYDGGAVGLTWQPVGTAPDVALIHWVAILPPGQTTFDMASFPQSLAALLPDAADRPGWQIQLIDYDGVAGYDALRALPEWQLVDPSDAIAYGDQSAAQVNGGNL